MPVTKQPTPTQWMAKSPTDTKCRPGLEIFANLKSVHLKQKIDMLEVLTGWQVKNKFRITNPETNEMIGMFKEAGGRCQRQCCNSARAFTADIVGEGDQVLFKIDRPLHCNCCCCVDACDGCCGQQMTVMDAAGEKLSFIKQMNSSCICCLSDWILSIPDASGQEKFRLENNICRATCCEKFSDGCCTDKYLYINDVNGMRVGEVIKKWRGCLTECCTPADALLINFPDSATPEDKAAIIAAVLLSDYNLWEQDSDN